MFIVCRLSIYLSLTDVEYLVVKGSGAEYLVEMVAIGIGDEYLSEVVAGDEAHYLLHTLDTQVLFDALCAMKEKRCVDIVSFSIRKDAEHEHRVYPLRFYISTQTGREYLLAFHYKFRKPMFFRLDTIRSITAGPFETRHEKYEDFASKFDENLWGVSTGGDYNVDHVELTLHVGDEEGYIIDRLEREKRHGRIEVVDEHTYKFIADVYDAGEMLTWVRSFIGRVIRFESDNTFAVNRFYDDVRRMAEMYRGGEEA